MLTKVRKFGLVCLLVFFVSSRASAQWAVHDPVNYATLIQILYENYKRYEQLRYMLNTARSDSELLRTVNQGILNSVGLLRTLPIEDEGILNEINNFSGSLAKVNELYGSVPSSSEELMQRLHDQTIAESFRMMNSSKSYARKQEENAEKISAQARTASPKGASRMAAESNALILHGISQLVRLQGQQLKMQSQRFARENRSEKKTTASYQKVDRELSKAFRELKIGGGLPRF